jgi:hypothetical protein
MLVEMREM